FPGDPYVIGFLRTYAEYLGLDPHAMLQSFRGMRIQEQPVPLEALLPSKKMPLWPFIVAVLVLAGGVGAYLLARGTPESNTSAEIAKVEKQSIVFDVSPLERRFFEGDELVVSYGGQRYAPGFHRRAGSPGDTDRRAPFHARRGRLHRPG
ncbi:MAG TPA: helix-turn-helix domain-containing protein, partial [Spirochaetales bacterium]|nr:helix-turn-helix domain-containing protein [Spirochaetales bacterium]